MQNPKKYLNKVLRRRPNDPILLMQRDGVPTLGMRTKSQHFFQGRNHRKAITSNLLVDDPRRETPDCLKTGWAAAALNGEFFPIFPSPSRYGFGPRREFGPDVLVALYRYGR